MIECGTIEVATLTRMNSDNLTQNNIYHPHLDCMKNCNNDSHMHFPQWFCDRIVCYLYRIQKNDCDGSRKFKWARWLMISKLATSKYQGQDSSREEKSLAKIQNIIVHKNILRLSMSGFCTMSNTMLRC